MAVINRVAEFQEDLAAWRRHLHQNPELGFEEHQTSAFVAEKLKEFGVDEIHAGIAGTGVVGVIRAGSGTRSIGIRADMDALPIAERSGKAWASKVPGKMHACGHDGHTTLLLGAARYLAETRNFDGTVYFYFQPAEEGLGGARKMVEEGLFERFPADQVFGLHNWPSLPVGSFAMCEGPAMAAADKFVIGLTGVGCHAAMPHLGRDPIIAASLIVQALQSIVSRQIDPLDNAVVSVTRISGGDTFNVVPERVEMIGTVRTYKPETQAFIRQRMQEVAEGIAAAQGLEASFEWRAGYPATVNASREAALGADIAAEIVGEDKVDRAPLPVMGAEDFSYMLLQRPGAYIWMGNGGGDDGKVLHSPYYDFNDEALPYGVSYFSRLAERLLPRAA
ncbi:M20 aminoacylase family protein [Geminicoccaceae bacterium 1502E]|nr:M20 aminoacylase family protein [Geminicoccaceae bacterium 1502E]